MKKRIAVFLLAVVSLFTFSLGLFTGCQKLKPSEGLEYTPANGMCSVTGIGSCTDTEIVIPSTYNGKPVTSIGSSAFEDCTDLKSVSIPDSVTSIGWYAFRGCINMTSVNIPDSVTDIDYYAFKDCRNLTSIVIPGGVTHIASFSFKNCSGLTRITIGKGVESIGEQAFFGCSSVTNIELPKGVKYIDKYAFAGCECLTSIEIPDSVTNISDYAFFSCPLSKLKYNGTIEKWNDISKGYHWKSSADDLTIICKDGKIDGNGNVIS